MLVVELALLLLICLCVVRANGRLLELEKHAGRDEKPVPADRILESKSRFPVPTFERAARAFRIGHELSEARYAGNGCWECPGDYPCTVRHTSNRVNGYAAAYRVFGDQIYRARAEEGLEYLLRVLTGDGDVPWFYRSNRGVRNRSDGLFEAGTGGRAIVEGYKLTGDPRLLDASARITAWEMECPISPNNNYNMFAVWHLAAHYELTGDDAALGSAIDKTKLGGMPNQFPSGGWPGHNSWMWYHGIIARGMAELLRVLPEDHPFSPELTSALTGALNRAIREQRKSGEVPANSNARRRGHTCPFILHALLTARSSFGDQLDNCIHGIMQYRLSKLPKQARVREIVNAWTDYKLSAADARDTATDEAVWAADFDLFVKDVDWGELVPDAFNCYYPCNDFDPKHQQWRRAESRRTHGSAQEIVSTGAKLFGGMGWSIPANTLVPGRQYRFTASVKCTGGPEKMPLILCSAYSGRPRPTWDPFSGCQFTRENPTFDSFSELSVNFTASDQANHVYVWAMGEDLDEGQSASIIADEARIQDAGDPLPKWDSSLDAFETEHDMMLLPTAAYLETMFKDNA